MIDRINNNSYTNQYKNQQIKKTGAEDAPKFLLGNEEEGVVWDRQDNKSELSIKPKEVPDNNKKANVEKKDVVELSVSNKEVAKNSTKENDTANVFGFVKNISNSIKTFFKNLFEFVWYGKDGDAENATQVNASDSKKLPAQKNITGNKLDEQEKDKLIRDSISRKDTDEMMRLLTDDYTKTPARNSNLLTQYDKTGKIMTIDGASSDRILTGKNAVKM